MPVHRNETGYQSDAGTEMRLAPSLMPVHAAQRGADLVSGHLDLVIEPLLVLVPEWRVAHQEDVENNTCPRGRGSDREEGRGRGG